MRYASTLAVLALVAAAGCSQSTTSETAAAPPAPAASAAASPAGAVAGPSFAGSWTSAYGPMTFTQTGAELTGTYGTSGGRVRGTVTGERFTGHWIGPGNRCDTQVDGSDTWGNLEMTLSGDGQRFDGRWSYCDRPVSGPWDGERAGAAASASAGPPAAMAAGGLGSTVTPSATQSLSALLEAFRTSAGQPCPTLTADVAGARAPTVELDQERSEYGVGVSNPAGVCNVQSLLCEVAGPSIARVAMQGQPDVFYDVPVGQRATVGPLYGAAACKMSAR